MRVARALPLAAVALLAAACSAPADGRAQATAQAAAPTRAEPQRPVADIITDTWGDPAQRDRAREAEQLAARLEFRPGMTVADIGAGSGYLSLKFAGIVGPTGRVYAQDIMPNYLRRLDATLEARKVGNVITVLGTPGDPKLPPASIDRAVMVHMYHEIAEPIALLNALTPAFKPGALLGIEDADRPTQNHGTPPGLLQCELSAAGYEFVGQGELTGGLGYLAVFKPPAKPRQPTREELARCRA